MARRWIIGMLAALALAACGGAGGATGYDGAAYPTALQAEDTGALAAASEADREEFAAEASAEGGDAVITDATTAGQTTAGSPGQQAQRRLVIRDASVSLLVDTVDEVEAQVRAIADERGGWVLSSQASGEGDQRRATISFKVPAERFDDALAALTALATKVDSLEVKGQDVTSEFVDLQSRLRNLEAVEQRLLQFLAEARTTEDALEVNAQLSEIQAQIEEAKGRITYLEQSSAYSTITVSLHAPAIVSVVPEAGWSPGTTAAAATNSLIGFAQDLADIAIVLVVWTPLWLPLLLLLLWLWRRSRRVQPPAAPPAAPPVAG